MLEPFERSEGESPYGIHHDLQEAMQKLVGIFRVEEDLKQALHEIGMLHERLGRVRVEGSRMFNPGWHLARDLRAMLLVTEAVAQSALARRESRGAHSRIDYPNYDPAWEKRNNVISRNGAMMGLRQVPVLEMPDDLKRLLSDPAEAKVGSTGATNA
jgi:succinate dehydrogenase / fumarate reductase flavoprotein subunit